MNRLPPDKVDPKIRQAFNDTYMELLKTDKLNVLIDETGEMLGSSNVPGTRIATLMDTMMSQKIQAMSKDDDLLRPWHEDEINYGDILPGEGEKDF